MGLQFIPVLLVISILGTIAICFPLSFIFKHVTYLWPYISDTGTHPPESCIFSTGLAISSVLIFIVVYVKYVQVSLLYEKYGMVDRCYINVITFIVGLNVCVGLSLVACFQETNVFTVHAFAAAMAFGGGAVYACLQSFIYWRLRRAIGQMKTTILRVFISVIALVTFAGYNVTGLFALILFKGTDVTKWKSEDGGFYIHVVSTILEWTCTMAVMLYILLFYEEFKYCKISCPVVTMKEKQPAATTI